jgi:hypothetical protein
MRLQFTRPLTSRSLTHFIAQNHLQASQMILTSFGRKNIRTFCTAATSSSASSSDPKIEQNAEKKNENLPIRRIVQEDDDYYDDYNETGPTGTYKRLLSWFVFGAVGTVVAYASYSIFMELFGRSAPNNLFNETFDLIRVSDEVMRMTGDPMRAYGMDTGRHSEGRRNFVASRYVFSSPHTHSLTSSDRKYKGVDGSNRTRIRYTVSGPRGKAIIYAEVSDLMQSHEFVYLITKDMKSGRVFTVIDNRTPADLATPSAAPPPQPTLLDMLNRK